VTGSRAPVQPLAFLAGGGKMGESIRALDWSKTPLGPPETWPESLRASLGICLNTEFPIAIYFGAEATLLYNDAWHPILGDKHPWALGRSGREVWSEIWDVVGPVFERVMARGEGSFFKNALLSMRRFGYTEECYFDYTFSPIRGQNESIEGVFNAVNETTFHVLGIAAANSCATSPRASPPPNRRSRPAGSPSRRWRATRPTSLLRFSTCWTGPRATEPSRDALASRRTGSRRPGKSNLPGRATTSGLSPRPCARENPNGSR
jgi:hypothetical protein